LENEVGQLRALREHYEQVAVASWRSVEERRAQYGDPSDLPKLLEKIRLDLVPVVEMLEVASPEATIAGLEAVLAAARRAQPRIISQLEKSIGHFGSMKERYQQAAVTSWQTVRKRREQYGDPSSLPTLLREIQGDLLPAVEKLELQTPQATIVAVDETLSTARREQLSTMGRLQRKASELSTLREHYEQASKEVVEDISVPSELVTRQSSVQAAVDALNQEVSHLNSQLARRRAIEQELAELRHQVQALPALRDESEQIEKDLAALEIASRRDELYNQILRFGQDYLEQAQPEHCPLCKQQIANVEGVLELLREESPVNLNRIREEHKRVHELLLLKRDQIAQLEGCQRRTARLQDDLKEFPEDIEAKIRDKQEENKRLTGELATIEAEIVRIEGRIKLAREHRNRLQTLLKEVEGELGRPAGENVLAALDQVIMDVHERAVEVESLDFEPIAAKLDQARQLNRIETEEAELRRQLDTVLEEVGRLLSPPLSEDVTGALDQAIEGMRNQVSAVESLDFEPIAAELDRAKELSQIAKDETELRRRLDAVLEEIEQTLARPVSADVAGALDHAIAATRKEAAEIQAIRLEPITTMLNRARGLDEIQKDETRLRELEAGYRTARKQKERLSYQIQRLTALRSALLDIAQTTKERQRTIVTGILNDLDIDRYYQQLDPHPAYRKLQIEPELTRKGTYSYWIKALTDDRSHGTYVQTRFSTAQANCAAIAIFLAVNQHLSKRLETLILDDPSQSMDPEHQMRLAQSLANVPRQVIVATEDPQMFEYLVNAFESPTVHQLESWTIEGTSLIS
jgi:DNA repair exonuclease SbcCD ATPase subunit